MSARSMASGTISFGLVAIPVKLYTTIDYSTSVSFNQLHSVCGTRLKQQMYCPTCDTVVEREDIVKGYEFAKGQYVLFSEEELKKLAIESTHAIEIKEFVPLKEVDPIYYDRSYFLGPDRGGDRPYSLLREALVQTQRAALGTYTARGKQYLILLRPYQEGLILQQLHYANEIKSFSEVPLGNGEVKESELKLAQQLIEQTATDEFRPENYRDEVRDQVLAMIEQKVKGEEIAAPKQEAPKAQIIDLMEALKASLGETEKGKQEKRKPPKKAASKSSREKKTPSKKRKSG
ncbi:MAG TPA: Ku protein [Acidobacteriota bacterium]|nr:Ku protein [Acidobacteriota bacterium]